MNFRLTAILFGTIFVLGVVLLIMSFTGDDTPPTDLLAEELVAFKPGEIDTVEFEREGGSKLKITRVDKDKNRWDIVEPFTAKADPNAVSDIVNAILKAKPTTYPELTSNPAVHGLQPPGIRVTLRAGERASTINFGDVTIGGNKAVVFVTTSARPKRPMAVPRSMVDALFREPTGSGKAVDLAKWTNDYRIRSVFAADTHGAGEDVTAFTLTYKGKNLSLARGSGPTGGWKFVAPAGWGDADPSGDPAASSGTFTGVSRLLGAITSMQALAPTDFIENPTPQQLTEFGLNENNPDAIKVELQTKNGETTTAFIGKKDASAPAAPPAFPGAPPQASNKWWVRVVGQPGVILANAGDLGGLAAIIENPDPLRDRNLLAFDKNRIDGLDLANGAVKLRKSGPGAIGMWKLYGNPGDPTPAIGVEKILDALTEKRTIKSFPVANPADFGPGEVTVRVWADGFEPPTNPKADGKNDAKVDPNAEPKEKGKPVTLTFVKKEKEGDSINVRRVLADGTTNYFLLPEKIKIGGLGSTGEQVDLLAAANKTRLELLDPSLKTFAATSANKLTVSGVTNYELEKDEKPDPYSALPLWRFLKPDDRKGKPADSATVGDMISILATTQSVTRFINENPDATKLAEYGLGPIVGRAPMPGDPPAPRLKVVIGLKDADPTDKERVYEFGKETGDANYVYARQAGRTAVFTLPKFVYDKFANADLRDRQLFRFDPAQATKVRLEGWGSSGFLVELLFTKNKDGGWDAQVKTNNGAASPFALDPAKLNAFLSILSRTRAKSFVPGPVIEGYGFGDKNNKLIIEVTTASGYISLNLGAPLDNGSAYYGWTDQLPPAAPVFTVDSAPFKTYKDSSGSFAK